ncbi:5-dehydro-4-deoxyglucarate dehydratase [Microbacterium sp. PRC9]|uniref:5-dehydro-4-deoxyglucarate dehydratase n=1 Tax=Microbacterium sp. PRC9 TaxID=2962591 RepID=UPI002881D6FC|nr:5-dehydro-4-deoxyglucarate dehydratase [Microbacterium sp. PRC9]MDT0144829.1 5-dehydro-4-deoxyglucarate dehydratase [Microbacterium sp. PRC9]
MTTTSAFPALDGVLFFPVTPFTAGDRVDIPALKQHVDERVAAGPGGVFIGCGTGEFHALSAGEYADVVRAGVEATAGRVPVLAGVGGPLGHARECVAAAVSAGVDGLLVMPPYLVRGPQDGVASYIEAIAASTDLPIIAYHRGSAQLTLPTVERLLDLPTLMGIKDGVGDVALAQQFVRAARTHGRSDVQFFNGLLTAEASQSAYRAIGIPLYSSAVFAMAPEIALAFYSAYEAGDEVRQDQFLDEFFTPLVRLRDTTPGFAVSLIKAGVRLGGLEVGGVRPPLTSPTHAQVEVLAELLSTGRRIAA